MTNEKKAQRTNVTIIWFLVLFQYASLFDIFPPIYFLTFYVKSIISCAKLTHYEFNLKRKKDPKTNLKCYISSKIRTFKIQREIEY